MTDQAQPDPAAGAAALVIRVWRESPDADGIKARITQLADLGGNGETTTVVTSTAAVYREVHAWLEAFVGGSGGETSDRDA